MKQCREDPMRTLISNLNVICFSHITSGLRNGFDRMLARIVDSVDSMARLGAIALEPLYASPAAEHSYESFHAADQTCPDDLRSSESTRHSSAMCFLSWLRLTAGTEQGVLENLVLGNRVQMQPVPTGCLTVPADRFSKTIAAKKRG